MQIRFQALTEDAPGDVWGRHFAAAWPAYRGWFLREGEAARPGFVECRTMLRRFMPELLPTWNRLVELAGGGDLEARMLSLYNPTPYMTGCSQAVWSRGAPLLVRNYDYHPERCEGMILRSQWHGRRVLAMSDSLWGVLDGVNDAGLCVSLAFGGRKVVGPGFGIPLILRYVLEFRDDVAGAVEVLVRVPSHMSYNVTVLDPTGAFATVHVSPDQPARVLDVPVATNHQAEVEWTRHAAATRTEERERLIGERLAAADEDAGRFVARFLEPPLFQRQYRQAFGTLYTAVYRPRERSVDYLWTARRWRQAIERFDAGEMLVGFADAAPA